MGRIAKLVLAVTLAAVAVVMFVHAPLLDPDHWSLLVDEEDRPRAEEAAFSPQPASVLAVGGGVLVLGAMAWMVRRR